MNNFSNDNEEINLQIRKFLKQVGVVSHQIIQDKVKNNSSRSKICIKLEIDKKEEKIFETIIK